MSATQSPEVMTSDEEGNQQASSDEHVHDQPESESSSKPSTTVSNPRPGQPSKPSIPMQKRRRVTRACDECRRKKIKCDGKQPCTHCTVYSYECTYDQPSNRRRNPAPAYIEALELRLQRAEAILRSVLPGVNLDDPKFDAHSIDQLIDSSRRAKSSVQAPATASKLNVVQDEDAQLQTMVQATGSLDLDDQGHWGYHGNSSGFMFMRNLRAQFGNLFVPDPPIPTAKSRAMSHIIESPKSASSSPHDSSVPPVSDLPDRETTRQLCRNTLDVACALMRFVHKPRFYSKVDRIFDIDPDHYTNSDTQFLPLLYVVLALGCLFAERGDTKLDTRGYESAIEQGFQYFQIARNMLDITDCRDLPTLQVVVFMILFLQCTAKLATCYSHLGIALRACCRLGLHRNVKNEFDVIEQEERKRIFWLIRKMDAYIGALLGLPQMLSAEDVDQQWPTEVDDEYVTAEGILPMPPDKFPLIRATNAHISLVFILQKVVKHIYPIKGSEDIKPGEPYSISHSRIRDIEQDLQKWMDDLPMELRPSDDAPPDLARVQQLLRLAYAHVQMMMYQPFLHYVSQGCEMKNVDKRSYACAAACVSVARNIVHITTEMTRRGLLIGSHWFVMYTAYFSILSLVFFVFENPRSSTGHEIMRDATEGRDMLASLAKISLAADRCTHSLNGLFAELPTKLRERGNLSQPMPASRKRPNPGHDEPAAQKAFQSVPNVARAAEKGSPPTPGRANTLPTASMGQSVVQDMSIPSSSGPSSAFNEDSHFPPEQWNSAPTSVAADSGSMGQTPAMGGRDGPSQQHPYGPPMGGNLPDLRGLMFPSTNPFAYGNQPISILEDAQMMAAEQQASFVGSANKWGTAGSGIGPANISLDAFNNPTFSNAQPQAMYAQERHGLPSVPRGHPANLQMDLGNLNVDERFWQQVEKGGRTGLTPGVNLDELFGSDGGWNPAYMDQGFGRTQ